MRPRARRRVNSVVEAVRLAFVLLLPTSLLVNPATARRLTRCWEPAFTLNVGRRLLSSPPTITTPNIQEEEEEQDGWSCGGRKGSSVSPLHSTTPAHRGHMFPWSSIDDDREIKLDTAAITFSWSPFKLGASPKASTTATSAKTKTTRSKAATAAATSTKKSSRSTTTSGTKKGGWFRFPGFDDFNKIWKEQLNLQKKIKKLEKDVSRDYNLSDRAKAAQYRYEVMQTLQGVRKQVTEIEEATRKLDRQDAKILRDNKEIFRDVPVRPEDLDQLLKQEKSLLKILTLDEQQWARMGSSLVGALIGLVVFPNHDFFGVIGAAALMTFLTTRSGWVGDGSRMLGFATVAFFRQLSILEKRFSLLKRVGTWVRDMLETIIPFRLPWSEAPSWRNAYKGEGFLHPDLRPPPEMKDAEYVEYLREVKRWVDAEEKAVLAALKKKLDDRIQEEMDRQAMKEQASKFFKGFWEAVTGGGVEIQQRTLSIELDKENPDVSSRDGGKDEEEDDPEAGEGDMDLFYDDAVVTSTVRGGSSNTDPLMTRLGGGMDDGMPGGAITDGAISSGFAVAPTDIEGGQ